MKAVPRWRCSKAVGLHCAKIRCTQDAPKDSSAQMRWWRVLTDGSRMPSASIGPYGIRNPQMPLPVGARARVRARQTRFAARKEWQEEEGSVGGQGHRDKPQGTFTRVSAYSVLKCSAIFLKAKSIEGLSSYIGTILTKSWMSRNYDKNLSELVPHITINNLRVALNNLYNA